MNKEKCPKCGCFLKTKMINQNESDPEGYEWYVCNNSKCNWKLEEEIHY